MSASVASRLEDIRSRIATACSRGGRSADDVHLVAVGKRQPLERLREAVDAGQACFGESRVQEAAERIPELPPGLDWHMIGPLQSNKIKAAARLFDTVHSVDRTKVARLLDKEAARLDRRIDVFVQINVGREDKKHGFDPDRDALETSVRPLRELEHLRIVGLMTIPPYEESPEDARRWFRELRRLRDLAAGWPEWQGFPGFLSMGMSHDFEIAVEEGATHVRVGTRLFGPRPSP